jgi:hypothetical protein
VEATPTKIIDYFSGFKQNLIPLFQRPYTWGERQCLGGVGADFPTAHEAVKILK